MSKNNMLLGVARGKIGDLVFYRDGGEQRTRTRVVPKNPRSAMQMAQRVKMANVPALYRVFSSILADSFTNRPSNQSGYNVFAKHAIAGAPYLTKEQALAGVVMPQPCLMSKGSLSPLEVVSMTYDDGEFPALAVDGLAGSESTIGAISTAIIAAYPHLQDGDKVIFVSAIFTADDDALDGVDAYRATPSVVAITLDSQSTTSLSDDIVVDESMLGVKPMRALAVGSQVGLSAIFAAAVDGQGALQTSTSFAVLTAAAQSLYDGYRTEQSLTQAIESYKSSADSVLR